MVHPPAPGLTGMLLLAVLSLTAPSALVTPASAQPVNAAATTEDACDECHSFNRVGAKGKSRLGWSLNVWRMEAVHGCRMNDGEREIVLNHLAENYPRRPGVPSRDLAEYLFAALLVVLALLAANLYVAYGRQRKG